LRLFQVQLVRHVQNTANLYFSTNICNAQVYLENSGLRLWILRWYEDGVRQSSWSRRGICICNPSTSTHTLSLFAKQQP
jgi:hypothetical protein